MIQFAREILSPELWAEAMPLLTAHWQEVAHFEDIPLDPDYAVYEASEAAGMLRCFTARVPGELRSEVGFSNWTHPDALVGYALFFVRPHPHYKSSLQAAQDVIYLDPSVRGGTGAKFIAWCDAQLAAEGVEVVSQHVKAAHDFGKLLQRQGYDLMDLIYVKRLNRVDSTRESEQKVSRESKLSAEVKAIMDRDYATVRGTE